MTDVDAMRPAPAAPTSGRRTWARHRTPLIVLITAATLLVGSVAAVASIASARQRAAQAGTDLNLHPGEQPLQPVPGSR